MGALAGGFSGLGALAEGYTQEAHRQQELQLNDAQLQRTASLHMAESLLNNPATPEEYKPLLTQKWMEISSTPLAEWAKGKGPSWDKWMKQLPQVKGAAPAVSPAPVTPPAQPPIEGTSVAPPVQLPAPPPAPVLAQAGDFHMLTPVEQQQKGTAVAMAHAQALIASGVSPREAYVASGLIQKPEVNSIPFGATPLVNGQPIAGYEGANELPVGAPFMALVKGEQVTLQNYKQRDGQVIAKPVATAAGDAVNKVTPSMIPTVRSSTTSDQFGVKSTTTSTSSKKLPGSASSTTSGGGSSKPAASTEIGSGKTPAEKRADFQNQQAAIKLAQRDATKAAGDTRNMVNLLDTQQSYMDGLDKGKAQPTPRQDLSLIVAAVRAMNPGTVRLPQKELELELKAGSYGDRARRWYDNASAGVLPADQRKDLFEIVKNETTTAAKNAAATWQQAMGKQPLPNHLQRFSVQSPSAPPAASNLPTLSPAAQAVLDKLKGK